MDKFKTIESKVFETVENAIKNDIRYKDYFIIVRSDNFYYVVGKESKNVFKIE